MGPTRASTLPRVSSSIATFRIARKRSLWRNSLTSFAPDTFMCERETSGIPTNTIVLTFDCLKPPTSLRAGYLTVPVRPYVPFPMRCFKCHKFGHGKDKCRRTKAVCGRCGKEHADQHQCTFAAYCINCKGDHPTFSKPCPKFLEEQAILRYKAEHGGTFQQARAAVIVETPKSVSSRTYAQALKPSLKPKQTAQPKVSDKVSAPVTPKAKASETLRPRAPREQCPVHPRRQGPVKPSKEGAPREKINRYGTISDMDVDSVSGCLSDERKSCSKNTRSLERPLPLFQIQSPPRPYPRSQSRSRPHSRPHPSSPTPQNPTPYLNHPI